MPWDEITGAARKPSWLLILSAGILLAITLRADWAASALALCPCVGAAAFAPWGNDAKVAPTSAATARPPRCLLRILSPVVPGRGPARRPASRAGRRWPAGCRRTVVRPGVQGGPLRTLDPRVRGVNESRTAGLCSARS